MKNVLRVWNMWHTIAKMYYYFIIYYYTNTQRKINKYKKQDKQKQFIVIF